MKQFTILAVGKIKEKFCQLGIQEFHKRNKHLDIVTIKDSNKEKESEAISEFISNNNFDAVIALDETGKAYTSHQFANFLKEHSHQKLCFLIGGPDGLLDKHKQESTYVISLSAMTFTHEMAQMILVEQLYRAQCINSGKKYHRD